MENLIIRYSKLNIYWKLVPFLLLYLTICILFAPQGYVDDEDRYIYFANNLLNGFFSPPYPMFNLWNGPGYPILIAPFLFLKLPLLVIRILNGFLLYFSLTVTYKTFNIYSTKKNAFLFTILIGLYFPIFEQLRLVMTETLAWFLISILCFLFVKNFQQEKISWKLLFLCAFTIAFLAMTKVIFGYVILLMLFASIFMVLLPAFRSSAKKSFLIFLISFVFCLPWLLYTYSLTNKLFYWTNSGSMSLYTMSTPYENELGDWANIEQLQLNPNHKSFMDSISKFNSLQKDDAYKSAAIKNIIEHPEKYFSNWIANVGRLFFSYPYSKTEQTLKTYWTMIPNMFILIFIVISVFFSLMHYEKVPKALLVLLFFMLVYLFGSSLISAYRRMFYITMPFWILLISYVFNNIISIKIKKD